MVIHKLRPIASGAEMQVEHIKKESRDFFKT
jgi:hypothetical protein